MNIKKYLWISGYAVALMIFLYGVVLYIQASSYSPGLPESAPGNRFTFSYQQPQKSLSRYSRLFQGELFFGKVIPPQLTVEVVPFHSNLKIYGLIRGGNPRAIVGLTGSAQTWIVKPGMTVNGEKIVAIGEKYLLVKNQTGEGKVTN